MPGLTLGELVRSTRTRRSVMRRLLQQERRAGRIEFVGGRWRPTSSFVREFGSGFGYVEASSYRGTYNHQEET